MESLQGPLIGEEELNVNTGFLPDYPPKASPPPPKNKNRLFFFKARVLVTFTLYSSYPHMILFEEKDRSGENGTQKTELNDL